MQKTTKLIIGVVGVILVLLMAIFLLRKEKPIKPYVDLQQELIKLDSQIDSLESKRDTLINQISISKIEVQNIEKWYEETRAVINNQSTDSDIVFFSKYLSNNSQ